MSRRPTARRRLSSLSPDLDLIPVMNLFMVLIPFLLLTAVFAKTVAIDIYLPQISEEGAGKSAPPHEVLTVRLNKNGFVFGGLGRFIAPVEKKGERYDFELLSKRLLELKKNHPDKDEVILLFDPATPYELVIKLMDATREAVTKESGIPIRKRLFPLVSVGENT